MKRVVIESPYRGDNPEEQDRNRDYAIACMQHSISLGEAPFASHLLYTQFLNETNPAERMLGIEIGLKWGESSDKVAVYQDLGISEGMRIGINRAFDQKKEVCYRFLPDYEDYKVYLPGLQNLGYDVCNFFNCNIEDLQSRSRESQVIADVRHVYCAVALTIYPSYSLQKIGNWIGRNHSTVLNSTRVTESVHTVWAMYERFCKAKKVKLRYNEPATKVCKVPME